MVQDTGKGEEDCRRKEEDPKPFLTAAAVLDTGVASSDTGHHSPGPESKHLNVLLVEV